MGHITDFFKNRIQDVFFRGQSATINSKTLSWSAAPSLFIGLIGGADFPNSGVRLSSTAYAVNKYAWPSTPNGRVYKVTTAGTTGASEPAWPTTDGGTVTDGTVVWTEATNLLAAGTIPEPSGGAYARQTWTCSLAAVMGCNLSTSASASTGNTGKISNLAAVQFPVATAAWGLCIFDAASAGNPIEFCPLAVPKVVGAGDQLAFAGGVANTSYGAITITQQ